jgi:plastocyanin
MANKYIWIIIIVALVVAGGIVYKKVGVNDSNRPMTTGEVKRVTITAKKDEWRFVPDTFDAVQGDRIILTIVNEDNYDHGIAIDAFGVSQRIPANQSITVDFVVTQPGVFPFYCSVPCGEGEVANVKRGHFDQVGKINVKSLISETR